MPISNQLLEDWREQLRQEAVDLEAEIESIQTEMCHRLSPVKARLATTRDKLQCLESLLRLSAPSHADSRATPRADPSPGAARSPAMNGRTKANVADVAHAILLERRGAMYYKDLADEIVRRGHEINSAQPGTYLLAYIGKDQRFERTKRGHYKAVSARSVKRRPV